jgi:hypothetical protein
MEGGHAWFETGVLNLDEATWQGPSAAEAAPVERSGNRRSSTSRTASS